MSSRVAALRPSPSTIPGTRPDPFRFGLRWDELMRSLGKLRRQLRMPLFFVRLNILNHNIHLMPRCTSKCTTERS